VKLKKFHQDIMSEKITTTKAENILPVELWTKILQFLHETHLRSVQDVCVLFWNIIQRFVEHGFIKSDFYDIKRPFEDIAEDPDENDLPNYFIIMQQDNLYFNCSKPNWLLGISFHGPYTKNNRSLKNLLITINVKVENSILGTRSKICKVKIPQVVLPVFFDKPLLLHPCLTYEISIDFIFNHLINTENMPEYIIEYNKTSNYINSDFDIGNFTFYQPLCPKENIPTKFAYLECGQIRHLYLWPHDENI